MTETNAALDAKLAAAFNRLAQAIRTQQQDQAAGYGLIPAQAELLLLLGTAEARNAAELASDLGVPVAAVANAARVLEHKTLVSRAIYGDGQEPATFTLTPLGRMQASSLSGEQLLLDRLGDVEPTAKAAALAVVLEMIYEFQRRGIVSVVRTCTTCRHLGRDGKPGGRTAYHCQLLDVALLPADLRVDCPEHEARALA